MPKRKKLPVPDYVDTGADDSKLIVSKSNLLLTLSQIDLSLAEFKILDLYLSRIDSHDSTKRTVKIKKGKLEQCLGIDRIREEELVKYLRNLFQVVKVPDETKRLGYVSIALFEKADAEPDDDGLWKIRLTCTALAREYIFNIDNLGYLKYIVNCNQTE